MEKESQGQRLERFGERKFVGVGVVDVEVAFAPRCVSGFGRWVEPCLDQADMQGVYVIDMKNQASPPGLCPLSVQREIEVAVPHLETGE